MMSISVSMSIYLSLSLSLHIYIYIYTYIQGVVLIRAASYAALLPMVTFHDFSLRPCSLWSLFMNSQDTFHKEKVHPRERPTFLGLFVCIFIKQKYVLGRAFMSSGFFS